ncbi:type II secretion system protein GspL [Ectopseudomonas mendocina]|uniref:Type II secretion system protein L n=1 Tax=Ectopseudomonas mendocina TaxID=300 RepID=A0ABZ2RDH4_ECTME
MSHWLYLLPDVQPTCCYWWQAEGPLHQGDLAQAAVALAGQPLTLLLPMEMASYHCVSIPPRSGRWMRQALSNAVEEQVIDEIDTLHLAHGPLKDKGQCAVAAINRDALSRCLEQLAEVNLRPLRAYLDADCLPADKEHALEFAGRWLLGGDTSLRFALTADELVGLRPFLPESLHWQSPEPPLQMTASCIDWQQQDQPWHVLSQGSSAAINLLQGEFQQHIPQPPAWRLVVSALVIAAFATLLQSIFLSTYLNHQSEQIQAETDAQWRQHFPDAGPLDDLASYISSHQHSSTTHYNGVALRLSELAQLWSSSHGALAQVQRLDYQADEGWSLQVNAAAFSDLQQLRENLTAQGLEASTDSSVRDIQGVSARFQIKE